LVSQEAVAEAEVIAEVTMKMADAGPSPAAAATTSATARHGGRAYG
jgi:hypothetical protein